MCIFFRSAIAFIKEHSPLGQTSPSFKNNPLCHRFKTWALNRKFDFYWSNYSSSASPLAFVPCSKPSRQSSTSYSALLKQRCQWLSFSEGDSLPQKEKSKRYSLHGLLNNPLSITCVFENTQYLNQIVSFNTFSHPLRSMYFTFFIPVCQYQWWKNINNDSNICICIISAVGSIPLLPSSPSSPASSNTAHVQPGAHRILASLPANLLFTSISFFF